MSMDKEAETMLYVKYEIPQRVFVTWDVFLIKGKVSRNSIESAIFSENGMYGDEGLQIKIHEIKAL